MNEILYTVLSAIDFNILLPLFYLFLLLKGIVR